MFGVVCALIQTCCLGVAAGICTVCHPARFTACGASAKNNNNTGYTEHCDPVFSIAGRQAGRLAKRLTLVWVQFKSSASTSVHTILPAMPSLLLLQFYHSLLTGNHVWIRVSCEQGQCCCMDEGIFYLTSICLCMLFVCSIRDLQLPQSLL